MPRTPNSTPLSLEEQEKVKTLSASGKTPHSIAKELSRSPHTIRRYLSCPEAQEQIQTIKEELSDMFEGLAKRMITSISDEDILKINAYQRTLSAAVGTDKMRLLREQSTVNLDLSIYDRIERELKIILETETRELQILEAETKELE